MNVEEKINHLMFPIEYYNSVNYCKNFNDFPILTKSDVINNRSRLILKNHNEKEELYIRTSGSSGQILEIVWNRIEYYYAASKIWERRIKNGISPTDTYALSCINYYENNFLVNFPIIINKNEILLSKLYIDNNTIDFYIDCLINQNVSWMQLQPSFAYKIGRRLVHTKKNLKNLKFLEVTGELLTQEMKTTLCGLFNVPVFNLYGIEEVGAIAYDDGLGNLEILEGNCILEILNDENMRCESEIEGNIIVTGLVNHVMPFVRYKTGDRGKFFIQNDKKYLIVLKARSNDSILLNGIEYDGSIFFNLVEFLNTNGKNINSFQFILKRGVLTCNFPDIKEKDLAFLIKNYFKENFSYEFQDIVISNEVLEIKKNSSKIKYFINQNI